MSFFVLAFIIPLVHISEVFQPRTISWRCHCGVGFICPVKRCMHAAYVRFPHIHCLTVTLTFTLTWNKSTTPTQFITVFDLAIFSLGEDIVPATKDELSLILDQSIILGFLLGEEPNRGDHVVQRHFLCWPNWLILTREASKELAFRLNWKRNSG